MLNVTRAVTGFERPVLRRWNLYGLSRGGCRQTACITRSIRAALSRATTADEQDWTSRIERLRTEVNASTRPLTRTNYGAGRPDSQRTADEMQSGVGFADTVGSVSRAVSKSSFWCRLLFNLIRTLQPASCIEMGTAVGISAAYHAAALHLNGQGSLTTLEGDPVLSDVARNNFQQLGLHNVEVVVGKFHDTLAGVLASRQPVDYVHVDGHHDEHATLGYFEQMLPFLANGALVVFDDIAWSDGMRRAWKALAQDQRVSVAVDLGPVGLCVVDGSLAGRRYYSVPLN